MEKDNSFKASAFTQQQMCTKYIELDFSAMNNFPVRPVETTGIAFQQLTKKDKCLF